MAEETRGEHAFLPWGDPVLLLSPGCRSSRLITGNKLITDDCVCRESEIMPSEHRYLPLPLRCQLLRLCLLHFKGGSVFPCPLHYCSVYRTCSICCLVSPCCLNLFRWFFPLRFQNLYLIDSVFPFLKAHFRVLLSVSDGPARSPLSWNCL